MPERSPNFSCAPRQKRTRPMRALSPLPTSKVKLVPRLWLALLAAPISKFAGAMTAGARARACRGRPVLLPPMANPVTDVASRQSSSNTNRKLTSILVRTLACGAFRWRTTSMDSRRPRRSGEHDEESGASRMLRRTVGTWSRALCNGLIGAVGVDTLSLLRSSSSERTFISGGLNGAAV